jgi:putative radical SAM enzyme (TIGR03279 family)
LLRAHRSNGAPSGLLVATAEGPAARAGLRAGDIMVAIDDRSDVDVLDLELAAADGEFSLAVVRAGRPLDFNVAVARGEWHGVELADGLGQGVRQCQNHCRFCFVDQLPAGLRPSLCVKDDDYRLSFLQGTFITLTNLSAADLERICTLRLSPLYVSLHDWDDSRRARLMGERARRARGVLLRLAACGIELHIQVVLCPGWNDGAALDETVRALAELDAVADVGVVPVSLAVESDLRRVRRPEAEMALEQVEALQSEAKARRGVAFVHAADELYLLAARTPPPSDAPHQYQNGIGIGAAFVADAQALDLSGSNLPDRAGVALLTGTLAAPLVETACSLIAEGRGVTSGCAARSFVVANELFGPHVTVTGLLGGREVVAALHARPLGRDEWLLAPRAFLPEHLACTLDDLPEDELRSACDGRLALGGTLAEAFATLVV